MITRESSDYTNEIEICESQNYGKVVVKTPRKEQEDQFWYWCEKIFGLHVRKDPSEIITKSKKLSELLDIVLPKALSIQTNCDGFSVLYKYIDYNHITEFDKDKAYQYGQFVGKIHQKDFVSWGNLYDRDVANEQFGKYICEVIDKYFEMSCSTHKALFKKKFNEIRQNLEELNLKSAGIILLDVDADQYVYDENSNIIGIVDYEAMVIGPREIELLMWEFYLGDSFSKFMNGYKEYCTYKAENMELYRFLLFLLDSLGSDLDFYEWFNVDNWFENVEIEINTGCNRKCHYCPNSITETYNKEMPISIYQEIIKQLSDIKYEGRLSYHFYNEPLLCKNLLRYIRIAKQELPLAKNVLYSNGDLLTEKLVWQLIEAGIELLVITNHNNSDQYEKHSFYDVFENLGNDIKEHIEYLHSHELNLTNRGGILKKDYSKCGEVIPCLIPDSLIVIDVDGNVLPCYEDYYKEFIMGNIMHSSIKDIFNNEEYLKFRNFLRHGKRKKYSICKYCDNYTMLSQGGQYDFYL